MASIFLEFLADAKAAVREVTPHGAERRWDEVVFVDVREIEEYDLGAIPGSVHIPRTFLEAQIETEVADQSTPLVVYCAAGVRSIFAAKTLIEMGYTDVMSMSGGFNQWKSEHRPWMGPGADAADPALSRAS
jgi:rhodanese-related sulfurtransferase